MYVIGWYVAEYAELIYHVASGISYIVYGWVIYVIWQSRCCRVDPIELTALAATLDLKID